MEREPFAISDEIFGPLSNISVDASVCLQQQYLGTILALKKIQYLSDTGPERKTGMNLKCSTKGPSVS